MVYRRICYRARCFYQYFNSDIVRRAVVFNFLDDFRDALPEWFFFFLELMRPFKAWSPSRHCDYCVFFVLEKGIGAYEGNNRISDNALFVNLYRLNNIVCDASFIFFCVSKKPRRFRLEALVKQIPIVNMISGYVRRQYYVSFFRCASLVCRAVNRRVFRCGDGV